MLADHTEVPSGIGYALEIRRVLARSLPEAFRSIPVRHLRPFVDRWHDSLAALAPNDVTNPNMAVLTPGSLSATYFEHVYLSRALGVPLVEGGDLVARDGEVLDQDPGRPAARAHAAAPARQLVRRSARAARRLCARRHRPGRGDAHRQDRAGQRARLGPGRDAGADAVPRAAQPAPARPAARSCRRSTCGGWASLRPMPSSWPISTLMIVRPCLGQDREPIVVGMLERRDAQGAGAAHRGPSRPLRGAISGDALAQPQVGRQAQPGAGRRGAALLRDAPTATAIACCRAAWRASRWATPPRQLGRLNGTLKDVWVLAEDAADVQLPPNRRFHQLAVDRGGADLQSRVADNLYWLGRYIERLDNDARLLRTTVTRVAQGAIGPRDAIELRLLGTPARPGQPDGRAGGAVDARERAPSSRASPPWRRRSAACSRCSTPSSA